MTRCLWTLLQAQDNAFSGMGRLWPGPERVPAWAEIPGSGTPREDRKIGVCAMRRWWAGAGAAGVLLIAVTGCGSDGDGGGSEAAGGESAGAAVAGVDSGAEEAVDIPSQVVRVGDVFTPDSFVGAGWKKSKEYSTETVPGAEEIWYGFFNQRDVEIRFFGSHEAALDQGVPVVERAITENVKRSRGGRLLDFSGGSFSAYNAYIVAGNAILLCELDISACEGLVGQLK